MNLDRSLISGKIEWMLAQVPNAELRLVGTASSVLRGIELPALDIDILFRERSAIDDWVAELRSGVELETEPHWLPDANQYFACFLLDGVVLELSTVEALSPEDTIECVGTGPWEHFDLVQCDRISVPAVATELRLLSELARDREDRYLPIIDFLEQTSCDVDLVRRGLVRLDLSRKVVERLSTLLGLHD